MMFGETAHARRPARKAIDRTGAPVLAVSGLTRHGAFEDVSLERLSPAKSSGSPGCSARGGRS